MWAKLVLGEHASSSLAARSTTDLTEAKLLRRRTSARERRRKEERLGRLEEVREVLGMVWAAFATGWVDPRRWRGCARCL